LRFIDCFKLKNRNHNLYGINGELLNRMTRFPHLLMIGLLLLLSGLVHAQNSGLYFHGQVLDEASGIPVPYATVAIHSSITDRIITGTATDFDGNFSVESDSTQVYLSMSFIGFENKEIRQFSQTNGRVDLGEIRMTENTQVLDVAEVEAERSTVEFQLDKRVFNVGKDLSSTGMSAMEVLK